MLYHLSTHARLSSISIKTAKCTCRLRKKGGLILSSLDTLPAFFGLGRIDPTYGLVHFRWSLKLTRAYLLQIAHETM